MQHNNFFQPLSTREHVRQVTRTQDAQDNLYWTNREGGPEFLHALCDGHYQVIGIGSYDACKAAKADFPDAVYLEDLMQIAEQMDCDAAESDCCLGPREEGVSWSAC